MIPAEAHESGYAEEVTAEEFVSWTDSGGNPEDAIPEVFF
jgi:hypothetical protein